MMTNDSPVSTDPHTVTTAMPPADCRQGRTLTTENNIIYYQISSATVKHLIILISSEELDYFIIYAYDEQTS